MPESAGSASASQSATQCFTVGHFAAMAFTNGRKVMSKQKTRSSASLTIQASWSGGRRGFTVCTTRPLPLTPK